MLSARATTEGFCAHCKGITSAIENLKQNAWVSIVKKEILLSTERKGKLCETGNGNNIIHLNL